MIDDLRASGLTMVVAWSLHVSENGDFVLNDEQIVSDAKYVGTAAWPGQMASLKQSPTSVNRLLFSVGAGGVDDFHHVQQLIESQGTGPDSILYRNFSTLKETIPAIDGIDFDDEDLFDATTTVEFARMLHEIGLEVTFCPYMDPDYWAGCLKTLNGTTPNLVTAFNLQCYSGGSGNDPADWIAAIQGPMGPDFDAEGMVLPGLWCTNGPGCDEGQCPDSIQQTFAGWKPTGIRGGWIWLLDDVIKCESSGPAPGARWAPRRTQRRSRVGSASSRTVRSVSGSGSAPASRWRRSSRARPRFRRKPGRSHRWWCRGCRQRSGTAGARCRRAAGCRRRA